MTHVNELDDHRGRSDLWPGPGGSGSVLVVSPATVPAVRVTLAGLAAAGEGARRGGPVVVVLVGGPSIGAVDGSLEDLVVRAGGELHLLARAPGGVAAAARLRWLVPDLARRSVRVLLPTTERRDGLRLVQAAGARHPVVVGSRTSRTTGW